MKTIPILYEDGQLVVFDKPSGILVTPAPGKTHNILTDIVNTQCAGSGIRLHPCHRLDQMTSGAIIYAKGKVNQQKMREAFEKEGVEKTYLAFVKGYLKKSSGQIRSSVKDQYQRKFARDSRGKSAITHFQTIRFAKGFTVIKVQPKTGRTNQIRIHFAEMGHPLLGERVYAFRKDFDVDMKRLALHCHSLLFKNPVTGKMVTVISDMPEDMARFIGKG